MFGSLKERLYNVKLQNLFCFTINVFFNEIFSFWFTEKHVIENDRHMCFYENTALKSSFKLLFSCRSNVHQSLTLPHNWSSDKPQQYLRGFSNIPLLSVSTSWDSDEGRMPNGKRLGCWEGPDPTGWKMVFRWFWLIPSILEN